MFLGTTKTCKTLKADEYHLLFFFEKIIFRYISGRVYLKHPENPGLNQIFPLTFIQGKHW